MNQLNIHDFYNLLYFWNPNQLYVVSKTIQNEWNLLCYHFDTICNHSFALNCEPWHCTMHLLNKIGPTTLLCNDYDH